jgi:RNA methyltransferase, TrmH family
VKPIHLPLKIKKMITSNQNQKLKQLQRLHRRRERERLGLFVVEGEDLIEAASVAGIAPVEGYRTPECGMQQACGVRLAEVAPGALAKVSALGSGTRALAVYEQRYANAPAGALCLYLHGLSDPGNVGACLRSAAAFGACSVALGPGTADPYSPKATRASMGAIFSVSLAKASSISELRGRTLALVARKGVPLQQAVAELTAAAAGAPSDTRSGPDEPRAQAHGGRSVEGLTVLVGAEREGLPEELISACDAVAHIPISSESLNAAIAASVALYEITRDSNRVRAS